MIPIINLHCIKFIIMKKILFSLLVLPVITFFTTQKAVAQSDYNDIPLDSLFYTDKFAFEGEVICNWAYLDEGGGRISTASTIRIDRIIKGDATISCGTIQIIDRGGMLENRGEVGHHSFILNQGARGVFVTYPIDTNLFEPPAIQVCAPSNNIYMRLVWGSAGFLGFYDNQNGGFGVKAGQYQTDYVDTFYSFLQNQYQLTYTDCGTGSYVIPKYEPPVSSGDEVTPEQLDERIRSLDGYIKKLEMMKKNLEQQKIDLDSGLKKIIIGNPYLRDK